MTRPRIAMVSGNGPPTTDGVAHHAGALLRELRRQRPDWDWIWVYRRPRWFHVPARTALEGRLIRPSHGWGRVGSRLAAATVQALRPDIVHVQDQIHSFHESDAAHRIAAASAGRVVTTIHEFHVELPSVRHTIDLIGISDVVIATDARNAQRCRDRAGRAPDHRWWSPATIEPVNAPRPFRVGHIVTFGHITPLKALHTVHRALLRLRARGVEASWTIVGPFHPEADDHHAELARAMQEPWIRFEGAFPDSADPRLHGLLASAHVVALPFTDGASIRRSSLQTAWAFGAPVATTPPPAGETEVRAGINCMLAGSDSVDAWEAAIEAILTAPELADRLRAGALETAERFSWRRLARLHLEMYEALLEGRPERASERLTRKRGEADPGREVPSHAR